MKYGVCRFESNAFREMKTMPLLERALRRKEILKAQ